MGTKWWSNSTIWGYFKKSYHWITVLEIRIQLHNQNFLEHWLIWSLKCLYLTTNLNGLWGYVFSSYLRLWQTLTRYWFRVRILLETGIWNSHTWQREGDICSYYETSLRQSMRTSVA
jgi:hypothetical protein